MSTREDNRTASHAPEQGAFSSHAQNQVNALIAQMQTTTNPEEMALLAEQLKLLSQQPASDEHTFDDSVLPDWAVHSEEDQEELDSFFNSPEDRGKAETAFAIPRGESDAEGPEAARADNREPAVPVPASESETAQAELEDADDVASQVPADGDAREPAPEPANGGEDADLTLRREDFATFRCIYESQDGQLALYEDADGHLTAVNTNRFA